MKEWQRTLFLLVMLAVAIGFLLYLRVDYEHQAINALR